MANSYSERSHLPQKELLHATDPNLCSHRGSPKPGNFLICCTALLSRSKTHFVLSVKQPEDS